MRNYYPDNFNRYFLAPLSINISLNNGEFRAVGKYHEGLIFGRYQNKNGAFFDFNMKRDSLYIEPNDTSKQKKSYSF